MSCLLVSLYSYLFFYLCIDETLNEFCLASVTEGEVAPSEVILPGQYDDGKFLDKKDEEILGFIDQGEYLYLDFEIIS